MWQVVRRCHPGVPQLSDLVGDDEVFRREHLFHTPLLTDGHAAKMLPSSDDLWFDLLRRTPRAPSFRLVKAGDTTGRDGVTRGLGLGNQTLTDTIDANAVIDRYRRGDTVVLQGLQHTNPIIGEFAVNLALALDHPVQVNAYLSPPDEQGLDVHFDYHDVFVIQLSGSKHWTVWDRLDRSIDPVKTAFKIAKPDPAELGDPLLEFTLQPGQILYLPRGYPHAATTTHEPSDHLTVGLIAINWMRYMRHALDLAASRGELRASLPADLLRADVGIPQPPHSPTLTAIDDPARFKHWMARAIWRRMPQTRLRPRTTPSTAPAMSFAPGPLVWVTERDGQTMVGIGDRVLALPVEATTYLNNLFSMPTTSTFDPLAVDGIDRASRDVIARRLVSEGVLNSPQQR